MTETVITDVEDIFIEEQDLEEEEALDSYSIETYGLDYDVRGLAQRFSENDIIVPFYQRAEVWNNSMKSSLIESLLIGLPVPGIFLSKNLKTGHLYIIDGRQRLCSIRDFYEEKFSLSGKSIQERFRGKKYSTLLDDDRRKLDNSILHATIVKQLSPEGNSGIIQIFKRLNEKPTPLTAQEIRASIFHGDFNTLIDEFNQDERWRTIWGKEKLHNRLKDQEMVLRFFAFRFYFENYKRPMQSFLDTFAELNKDLTVFDKESLERVFYNTVDLIVNKIGSSAFKQENKSGNYIFKVSIFDAAMVGISLGIENGYCTEDNIENLYVDCLKDEEFLLGISEFTNDQDKIEHRINAAKRIFANIK